MADLKDFAGQMPYDSELLGIFQPLLGWRGASGRQLQREALVERVVAVARLMSGAVAAAAGAVRGSLLQQSGNPVIDYLSDRISVLHPGRTDLTDDEWRKTITPDLVQAAVQATVGSGTVDPAVGASAFWDALAAHYQATGFVVQNLVDQQPGALNNLLIASSLAPPWIDYISRFPKLADAVLTPVGILHLFREYFFELDSFLGPPVGHVWLSPGSTVELYESTVRRQLVEKSIESTLEITTRSEMTMETKEELSEAVKQENADDMKLAVSASGGFNVGVAHAEASASFNLDQARKTAAEQTHKRTRSQTEKKSTEIRQSFKTTFRTVTEQTDTTSKRYVLQNTTNQLVNYELRRKMRRVAVQLQHLGTRLCWQYYIDQPSSGLRISRLVHLAKMSDADVGLRPPERPPDPDTYDEEYVATLPWQPIKRHDSMNWDETWVWDEVWKAGVNKDQIGKQDPERIQAEWEFRVAPRNGYELKDANFVDMLPQGDLGGAPELYIAPVIQAPANNNPPQKFPSSDGRFVVRLPSVNFHSAHGVRLRLKLRFGQNADTVKKAQDEFAKRIQDYQDQRARAYQEAFVRAVRDRIKAVGDVKARSFSDLREEERHSIYRRLVDALTLKASGTRQRHIFAEIIRQLFDIDAVLYFVAPDWWDPSSRHQAVLNVATPQDNPADHSALALKTTDELDWGQHFSSVGDPYLVTEEARPAPLGASLGWVIQLDGDPMRNALLNSAWAKVVVPIRPGREHEAIAWLRDQVEQDTGLNASYQVQPNDPPEWAGKTIGEILDILITDIQKEDKLGSTKDPNIQALPGERVFEKGFDPLAGGVRFDPKDNQLQVFDQWIEALPTDQVVAVEYKSAT